MIPRKIFGIFFLFLILTIVFLTGCSTENEKPIEIIEVRINEVLRSPFYAPLYIAISQNFFQEEFLEVELQTSWNGAASMAALMENTADIGLIGGESLIHSFGQKDSKNLIGFAQLTQRDGSFLVAREPTAIFDWKDIQKKIIIGGRKGSTPQIILESILMQNQLSPQKELEIIHNIPIRSSRGAFQGGIGDYIQVLEPDLSIIEQMGIGTLIASLGQYSGEMPHTLFIAEESFVTKNPLALQRFTNAIYKAQIWSVNHSPEEIAGAIKSFFPDLDLDVLIKGVNRYQQYGSWASDPLIQTDKMDTFQEIMLQVGELEEKIPFENLINTTFAQEAINNIPLPEKDKK